MQFQTFYKNVDYEATVTWKERNLNQNVYFTIYVTINSPSSYENKV